MRPKHLGRHAVTSCAVAVLLAGCGGSRPLYSDRPGLTALQDVHVRSLSAVKGGVWFVDATGRSGALTIGFLTSNGSARRRSFLLKDKSLLPNEPPGSGQTIQPLSRTAVFIGLSAPYPEPPEIAIATVRLDGGAAPSLAIEKGVEDLGTLALASGRLFFGESRATLGELKGNRIIEHRLPANSEAPKNTLIAISDGSGRVLAGDGHTNRLAIFSPRSARWTFAKLRGVTNFAALAVAPDGSFWALSGRFLTRVTHTGVVSTFDLFPNAGEGLAVLAGGAVCTGSDNKQNAITCITHRGKILRYPVPLRHPPAVVASIGRQLWYAIVELPPPSSSFGDPDWGSAVGRIRPDSS